METTRPKISVITCFYNVAEYLQEAIESVLAQSYSNWELLLVDDGSTDGSTHIAKQYARQHPAKIIYCEHNNHINKGLSASRNLALAKSSGEIIAFLDADDVWRPVYLEKQLSLMEQLKVSVLCEATEYWHNWNNPQKENQVVYIGAAPEQLYYPPQLMLHLYPLGKGAAPCMCGVMLKKDSLVKLGGFEDDFRGMYEDQVFLSKLYLNEPVYISSCYNNLYRQRPGSLVGATQQTQAYHQVRVQYLRWLKAYIQGGSLRFTQVDKLLQEALAPYSLSSTEIITKSIIKRLKSFLKKRLPTTYKRILKYNLKVK